MQLHMIHPSSLFALFLIYMYVIVTRYQGIKMQGYFHVSHKTTDALPILGT